MTCYKAVFGDRVTQNDNDNICDHCFECGAPSTPDAAGTDLTASPDIDASRGLAPATVRRLLGIINFFSIPTCLPLAGCAILVGIGCVALAWRGALPAVLPGDEWFNLERVASLTLHTLVNMAQPLDAPAMPALARDGVGAVIAGIFIVLVGFVLHALRGLVNDLLVRSARDVRLVVFDDAAAAVVAAEPTDLTVVLLGRQPQPKSRTLTATLDAGFLADTLPRCASNTRELLALGLDTDANINLARRLVALRRAKAPARPLDRLFVRIDSRELRRSIGRDGFAEFADGAADARLISLPEARCRWLLRDQPPSKMRLVGQPGRAAIVVVGLGDTGLELLARLCAQAQSPHYDPLTVILVDTEAPAIAHELTDLWPALALAAAIIPLALESHLPLSATFMFRYLHQEELVPTCVYIALEDPALAAAWEREVGLAVRLFGQYSPLVLTVGAASGTDRSLLIGDETLELLPRRLHELYLQHRGEDGSQNTSSMVEWSRLPFDLQEDNRSVADHLWTKARDLDLRIVPGGSDYDIRRAENDIQGLAAAEHRRWIASRAVAGWRFGATLSQSERTHPSMIPWAQLAEAERAKDRDIIWRLPEVLRAAGLFVQPLYGVALKRGDEANAETLVATVRNRMASHLGATPHLVLAVEDVRSFRLAKQLLEISDIAVSFVVAQPLLGLAIAAGVPEQTASEMASLAQTVWLTSPDTVDDVLKRWPVLEGAVP
jgi:hypothetical protein